MRSAILATSLCSVLLLACGSGDDGGAGGNPGKTYPTEQLADLPGYADNGPAPFGIALDDTHVYVSVTSGTAETGSIIRIPKEGGAIESVATGVGSSKTLAVVNGTVYFDDDAGGGIRSVATSGGEVSVLTEATGATDLTVSGDQVVFTNAVIAEPGLVGTVATTGGDITELFESNERPAGIAVRADTAYVALLGPGNATGSEGSIVSVPLAGGSPEPVASLLNAPRAIVVEEGMLYATLQGAESSDGAVVAITLPSGPVKNLANWRKRPWGLATDATNIYWVNRGTGAGDGTVMKLAKDGGVPSVLADKQGEPRQIAVDDSYVYWTNFNTGEVMRVAK